MEVLNPDGVLHNLRSDSRVNTPINIAQPKFRPSMTLTIEKPEIMPISCDVHPWMSGWFFVAANPYFSVADGEGRFQLTDVPPGRYTLEAWHGRLGTQTKEIEVKAGEKETVNFEFSAPAG